MISEMAIIDKSVKIGENAQIWHYTQILSGVVIGCDVVIGHGVFIGEGVKIGNGCKIQGNCYVPAGVVIEDDAFLAPSVVFTNVKKPRANYKQEFEKTIVCQGAVIGANATIVCGIEIGEYSFVGAGAVVTKNVEPYALMIGVPAKRNGWVDGKAKK